MFPPLITGGGAGAVANIAPNEALLVEFAPTYHTPEFG